MSAAGDGSTEPNHYLLPLGADETESHLSHQSSGYPFGATGTFLGLGLEQFNVTVRWTVTAEGWTEENLYFLPLLWEKMKTSPISHITVKKTWRWTFFSPRGVCRLHKSSTLLWCIILN